MTLTRSPAEEVQPSDVADQAEQCIAEGRYEEARELLDEALRGQHLARARAELARGSPADALVEVDRALDLDPNDMEVRLLKADASLRLAEERIRDGGGGVGLIEGVLGDALEYYQSTGESAHALYGASRAAWLLGRNDEALDLARRARTLRDEDDPSLAALGLQPERIYAEQVFAAYAREKTQASEAAPALFRETEEAFARLLGRASDDPWTWGRLADLYEWEGRLAEAKGTLERGLKRVPEAPDLLERLARVTLALEGPGATVATFLEYHAAHPEVAAGHWQLAVARFQAALEDYKKDPRVLDPAAFTRAEEDFRATRETAPEFFQGALGYEVVCHLARGWCAFHGGDLAGARREFRSMNELFARGIEWSLPGVLESGIQGLFEVADAYSTQDQQETAGEIFEELSALQPDQYLWANNAGFFLRDASNALEAEGKRLCRAARGLTKNPEALTKLRDRAGVTRETPGSPEESAAFLHVAEERFQRARPLMERSWKAYERAAALAPEDVRVVNDAALVLVYYLHRDLDVAERMLLRCVELGGPQVEAKRAALAAEEAPERASQLESELALLTEAWGDAHQNLGVLAWVHRHDAEEARRWLEKAVAIGPERQSVVNSLLPQVRGERAPEEDDPWDLLHWARVP